MKLLPEDGRARKWWIASAGGAAVLVAAAVVYAVWPSAPAPDAPPAEVAKYVASEAFARLSDEQKKPYLDAAQELPWEQRREAWEQLTDEERGRAMRNFGGGRREKQLDEYFALPPGKQRVVYLDKLIDEQEKRRAEWSQRRQQRQDGRQADGGREGAGNRGQWADRGASASAARMNERIQNTPPARRAQWA